MKPLLLLKRLRSYEIIAFVTGFTLMVYELVASRILAPSIGSSTYVWTSVIGVIIAALSFGYAAGGWLADKRVNKLDIAWLLIACAITVMATLLFSSSVLDVISDTSLDARVKGLLAATILFTPTSFVLGCMSPYLVRLHTDSIKVAGRSVASLSALNALGGIVGTFSAGFIFFSWFGSQQTLGLVTAVLLAASWLIVPRTFWQQRALACLAIILLTTTSLVPTANAASVSIDTPTANYKVIDANLNGRPARVLAMGPAGWQSGTYLDDPNALPFQYTQMMAGMVGTATPRSVLVLGGGAFTLPSHIANTHPYTQVDVVEIDPKLEGIAKKYFGFQPVPNLHVINADGRAFLNTNTKQYDMILVDIFSDTDVPFAATTTEYVQALHKSLAKDGVVLVNVIGSASQQCAPLLGAVNSTYSKTFAYRQAFPSDPTDLRMRQNIIAAYANSKPSWMTYYRQGVELPVGQILTDNYAPVERLHQMCKQH